MEAKWALDTTLSGRDVVWTRLGAAARTTAPGPCALVAVLDGAATVGGRALARGELAFAPGEDVVAGGDGCMLAALRWDGDAPAAPARVESTASRHFEKYESFQAQLRVLAGDRDLLAPWELYRVRMIAEVQERVQLHVHHVVTNLLFVPGPVGVERGYLILCQNGRVTASPLLGGDRAIVRPGLHHHVVPIAADHPIDMVVLNDQVSAYEDLARSDFHLMGVVPWSEVEVTARAAPEPGLTVVG